MRAALYRVRDHGAFTLGTAFRVCLSLASCCGFLTSHFGVCIQMSDFVCAMLGMGCVFSSWVDICLDLSYCFVFRSWVPSNLEASFFCRWLWREVLDCLVTVWMRIYIVALSCGRKRRTIRVVSVLASSYLESERVRCLALVWMCGLINRLISPFAHPFWAKRLCSVTSLSRLAPAPFLYLSRAKFQCVLSFGRDQFGFSSSF